MNEGKDSGSVNRDRIRDDDGDMVDEKVERERKLNFRDPFRAISSHLFSWLQTHP